MRKLTHYPIKLNGSYSKNRSICGLVGVKVSSDMNKVNCKKCKQKYKKG